LTLPIFSPEKRTTIYRIAIVTDLDTASKSETDKDTWFSYMKYGQLTISEDLRKVSITWDKKDPIQLKSNLAQKGRSMELSDLKVFNGHLLTADDRTGILYRFERGEMIPWVLLTDGNGIDSKGFKVEWMATKNQQLYVGGLGKEWTSIHGELQNFNPMWIKVITPMGGIKHIDWRQVYTDLRAAAGIHYPGYMIHESAQWSDIHQKWFFLPRRASNDTYTEADDEHRGTNYLLIADEKFKHIEVRKVSPLTVTRGFSAFQFIPGTKDTLIVALKSEEDRGNVRSYITVFDLHGNILVPETMIEGNHKYEGIEFV